MAALFNHCDPSGRRVRFGYISRTSLPLGQYGRGSWYDVRNDSPGFARYPSES